jgi:hypothetical protein
MTHRSLALLVVLPALAACSVKEPTAPVSSRLSQLATTAAASAHPARPAGGHCETAITYQPPQAGDPANYLRLHIDFVCTLKHLGRTTSSVEQLVIFTSPTTAIASNTGVHTAANGDLLYSSWTGTSTSNGPDIQFSGPETIQGGTGRFVHASGSTWVVGTASFVTNTGEFTSVGTISY